MREGGAHERPELAEKIASEAVEVARHGVGVDHVHVELALGDGAEAEAKRHLPSAGRVGGEHGDCRRGAVVLPAVHHAARVPPAVLHLRVGGHGHLDGRDVGVILVVGGHVLHVHAADEPLRAVRARLPRPLQRAAAVGEVHRELEPQPRALLYGEHDHLPPFGAAEGQLHLGLLHHLVVAARVEHQDAAEADPLHCLQVGGDRLAVHVAVHPVPVAPRTRRVGRRPEVIVERRRKRQRAQGHAQKDSPFHGISGVIAVSPCSRWRWRSTRRGRTPCPRARSRR